MNPKNQTTTEEFEKNTL